MTSSLTFRVASLSSSPAHQGTRDVFVSFQGEDTRRNFISHLYDALNRRGFNTYINDEQPRIEENISSVLLKTIEESRASVVILSKNYASSSWCLDELQKILEYKETKGQIVLPVFYQVDPSDVQLQKNSFGEAFARLEKRFKDDLPKVRKWRAALSEIANLSGVHLNNYGDEAKCIDEIVQKIANHNHVNAAKQVAKHPIAIKSPLHVLHSSSSPAQVPDSSSSPSPVGIESPAQVPDSSSSPSPVGIQAPVEVPASSSSPPGNGEQGSNSFKSILPVIGFYIGSVIGTLQLAHLFETHPVNMWILEAALVICCLLRANMNNDGTRWAKYSRINKNLFVLSGTLVLVSLISIPLPHQLWWLFFVTWALMGFIFVAHTWIYAGVNRRNDEEKGEMIALIRPTNSLTREENSSDAAHFLRKILQMLPILNPLSGAIATQPLIGHGQTHAVPIKFFFF